MMGAAALFAALPAYAQQSADAISPADLSAYVRARAADADGAADIAAAGYALALNDVPDDAVVATRAYRQGLLAGDYALASRAAASLVRAGKAPADVPLYQYAVALEARDKAAADDALARLAKGPLEFMVPVLEAWRALDAHQDPLARLDPSQGTPLARRAAAEHHALLLIATGKAGQGLDELRPLLDNAQEDLRIDAALLLAGTGKRDAAKELLAGDRSELVRLRESIGHGARPGAAFGTSRLLLGLAVDLVQEDANALSVMLTRTVLLLEPGDDRARLFLAEALSRAGADRLALATLTKVKPSSPFARGAAAGEVAALRRAGELGEAIAHARALAEDHDATLGDVRDYAGLLAANGQYDDAARVYGNALGWPGGGDDWQLYLSRGSALDRAGRWSEAVDALRRAVSLAPGEPSALTSLGNALVAHREGLDEAQGVLERANGLKPDDPHIADSLGWAYFLRGDKARALPLIEAAAQADPGDSQVNEHLGDVYWQLGRRYEARYAWRAAAIGAGSGAAERIEAKLANGPSSASVN